MSVIPKFLLDSLITRVSNSVSVFGNSVSIIFGEKIRFFRFCLNVPYNAKRNDVLKSKFYVKSIFEISVSDILLKSLASICFVTLLSSELKLFSDLSIFP